MEMQPMAGGGGGEGSSTLVSNGAVDIRGKIADKTTTGGWRASPFIVVNEVAERMAFYAIAINMVMFLQKQMHENVPDAASHVTDWIGAAFFLTIVGAFLADAYLGRFFTILIFSSVYAAGTVLLTVAASIPRFRPPPCFAGGCESPTPAQNALVYGSLALIALGTGGIKPCISSFGADQFDESDPTEVQKKYSFFNWFFFAINLGVLLGITLVAYVEDQLGWGWGFGMSAAANVASIAALLAGSRFYRYHAPRGSPFTRFAQVVVAACRNHSISPAREADLFEVETKESAIHGAHKLPHTKRLTFFDKAAVIPAGGGGTGSSGRWRLCTVTQVEEFKSFVRVLPIWATTIAFPLSFAQLSLFLTQAAAMDRHLSGSFVVPPGSVAVFTAVNALIFIPLYERVGVPLLRRYTGHPRGLSSLHRIGIGMLITIPTFSFAAIVEHSRRTSGDPSSVTFWWLFPQYFLLGFAEVFTYVGELEFFYDGATDGTRSLSSAICLSEVGIGNWLSTLLLKIVEGATGGAERGWLRNNLNESRLDYYYWIVCGINAVNFCIYVVVVVWFYEGNGRENGLKMEEEEEEEEDDDEKSIGPKRH